MKVTKNWTIEKLRSLPPDNIFGVVEIQPNLWQIGGEEKNDLVMYTGNGGAVEFMNQFFKVLKDKYGTDDQETTEACSQEEAKPPEEVE